MDASVFVHVAAGGVSLVAGALALGLRKGAIGHRRVGYLFVAAMVVMAVPGGFISYAAEKPFDVLSSVVAIYVVLTGLWAFRPMPASVSVAAAGVALMCMVGYLSIELITLAGGPRGTDAPIGAGFLFATVLGAGGAGRCQASAHAVHAHADCCSASLATELRAVHCHGFVLRRTPASVSRLDAELRGAHAADDCTGHCHGLLAAAAERHEGATIPPDTRTEV